MNAQSSLIPTYSARAFARRPVVPTLRKPDAKALLASVPNAKPHYVWPCYPIHPECPEVDCKHWDEPERWEDEQMPAPTIGDTEWNALPVILHDGGAHGKMPRHAWGTGGHMVYVPLEAPKPATTRFDTSPLVRARERKEAELLLKIAPQNDCLHVELPAAPVVEAPIQAAPVASKRTHDHGVPIGCSRYGILPQITPCPDDLKVTLWREDGFGKGRLS